MTTTRGAEIGPPEVVSGKGSAAPRQPRLGPLPEPTLLERIRASWSLYALIPGIERDPNRRRNWRPGALLTLSVHAILIFAIVVMGKFAIGKLGPDGPDVVAWLPPARDVPKIETKSEGEAGPGDPSAGSSDGRGGNTDPRPATNGNPPPPAPVAPIPAPITPPVASPSLTIPQTVEGPAIDVPTPSVVGIPGGPPSDDPSLGTNGGAGVGNAGGNQAGNSTRPGRPGGGSDGADPATRPGAAGPGTGLGEGPTPGTPDRGIRLVGKVKPTITPAMIEAGTFGTVQFRVTIAANGTIVAAEPIVRLANGGTQAALVALYKCHFLPAIKNGKYVTDTTVVRFDITDTSVH